MYCVNHCFSSAVIVVKTSEDVFDVAEALQPNTTGKKLLHNFLFC